MYCIGIVFAVCPAINSGRDWLGGVFTDRLFEDCLRLGRMRRAAFFAICGFFLAALSFFIVFRAAANYFAVDANTIASDKNRSISASEESFDTDVIDINSSKSISAASDYAGTDSFGSASSELSGIMAVFPALAGFSNDLPAALELYDALYKKRADENQSDGGAKSLIYVDCDLSGSPEPGELLIINETHYTPDLYALLESDYPIKSDGVQYASSAPDEPLVLILHTHGTEGYAAEGASGCSADTLPRSSDITENVVAVGKVLADTLISNGVSAVHCDIMHDIDSYIRSYELSAKTAREYIKQFPSIKYIFDVHRDAIYRGDGLARTNVVYNGKNAAQMMFVVGTDENGALHPNWKSNLTVALKAQYLLNGRINGIMRPINLRSSSFNAQLAPGAMLIEIGTCANTLAEAKRAAVILGETLALLIKNG